MTTKSAQDPVLRHYPNPERQTTFMHGIDKGERPFLEQLPATLDFKQRMVLETLGVSASMIRLSIREIRSVVVGNAGQSSARIYSYDERRKIFLHAWSIVDQLHNTSLLSRLLKAPFSVSFDAVKPYFFKARSFRNKMDHLAQNMGGNLLKSREKIPSIFGTITFLTIEQDKNYKDGLLKSAGITVLFGSGVHHENGIEIDLKECSKLDDNCEFHLPCDNFILHAFDSYLNLTKAVVNVLQSIEALNIETRSYYEREGSRLAAESGVKYEDFMKPAPGSTTVLLKVDFGNPLNIKLRQV